MDISLCKEEFSYAYIRAIAAVAGYAVWKPQPDIDCVDLMIAGRGSKGTCRLPRIEVQVKCTSMDVLKKDSVKFPLEIEHYDSLRLDAGILLPRILIVVVIPDNRNAWLTHSERELAMRHCGYWVSLRGQPASKNTRRITVTIPRVQQFTAETLCGLMDNMQPGGEL